MTSATTEDRIDRVVAMPKVELHLHFEGAAPPAWKMAVLTWIAVNPAVYIFANGVPRIFGVLPPLVELLVVNLFVVATLTWAFMPLLGWAFAGWLQGGARV